MTEDYLKVKLDNGLLLLLKEIHTAPIISHWVWYRIGSRNEVAGKTGISHWVEHMQFKGTPKYPAGVLDEAVSKTGGYWNAFTYLDWTAYFQTLPASEIDLALSLESDRMVYSLFEPDEVEAERTVIISELEGSENEPLFRLGRDLRKKVYPNHTYGNEIIGSLADLKSMSRDDLFQHYRRYYNPSNAVIAIAGDFDLAEMREKAVHAYQGLAGTAMPRENVVQESTLLEPAELVMQGPGTTTYIDISYRSPNARDKDFYTLSVLDSLLSGASSLNMFGSGGISNRTSRLYQALVEDELAVSVSGGLQATIDPYLYSTVITVHPAASVDAVLLKFDDEVRRLQDTLVPEDQLQRAVKQAKALFAYGTENITNQAFWLGHAEMFDGYDWFLHYVDRLAQVTSEDIRSYAREKLNPRQRVVGVYQPNGKAA